METYISTRKTLRKIFVIVDSRHGKVIKKQNFFFLFLCILKIIYIFYKGIKLADMEFLEMLDKLSI
jgi:hypothetical protein